MQHGIGTNAAVSRTSKSGLGLARGGHRPSLGPTRAARAIEPLFEIVETAILPRLMAAHRVPCDVLDRGAEPERHASMDIAAVIPLALSGEAAALLAHVEQLLRQDITIESVFVDLLAPAARHIGVLWDEDRCDFLEATMALWRLQEVVRELAARVPPDLRARGGARRVLCAAMPGDQHSFGTVMVDETFRRQGWDTDVVLDPTTPELMEHVARKRFDVVGLTVSCDCNIGPLPSLIHAMRSVSRNPRLVVLVGGRVFMDDPMLAIEVGADGTAADAVQAVVMAEGLVRAVAREMAMCG